MIKNVSLEVLSSEGNWKEVYQVTSDHCSDPLADGARQFNYIDSHREQYNAQAIRVLVNGRVMLTR